MKRQFFQSKDLIIAIVSILLIFAIPSEGSGQDTVSIDINLNQSMGEMYPMWAYFGYDEPNYTYMPHGKKLLTEISELSEEPVFVRAHNLLNTDEGPRAALKWGSSNAYTEDENGNPVYDWEIVDRIFDTYIDRGMKPLVEVGFMPKALSSNPEPYRHYWSPGDNYGDIYTGWAYPPNDYEKWAELIYQWVLHSVDRYGEEEVSTWWWELWNEPNIGYWQGTKEEYFKLYDYTVDAIRRALPSAKVGGPTTTGPRWDQAAGWLRDFMEHCHSGTNFVTGETGTPLDFISFHAKGSPDATDDGFVQMDMGVQLEDVAKGFEIVASFPEYKDLPIIIGEADPEGCAACSFASGYRHNGYRNGTMYSSYTASSFAKMYELADQYGVNFEGALSWSFEFENQPWFDGFRSLATNGVDKPVLNVFRMYGMMGGERVEVVQENPVTAKEVMEKKVRDRPDIHALVSRDGNTVSVMVWNYHDNDLPAPDAEIKLNVKDLPADRVLIHHYRIDEDHSNSYTVWREMGAPQQVTMSQYEKLEKSGQLEMLTSPQWEDVTDGDIPISFSLPRQGVSLVRILWEE